MGVSKWGYQLFRLSTGDKMEDIFEVKRIIDKEKSDEMGVCLGIRLKIDDHEITCPVLRSCNSYKDLEIEVQAIEDNLKRILSQAKDIFQGVPLQRVPDLEPDMEPEKIWATLSETADEDPFINSFNSLDEAKRKEVAEYVLTRCNIFSGKASVFSYRYNNDSGLLE